MKMAAEFIQIFDGRETNWWLIQTKQYFGSRKMSEQKKLELDVAFALKGDALDWWLSWKKSNPNNL